MTDLTQPLINGVPAEMLSAADRGLQYGDGLFETIAVLGGQPRFWARHMVRLTAGCERLGLPAPDVPHLRFEAEHLLQHQERCVLKILLTRGVGGRGYRPDADQEPTRILRCLAWPTGQQESLRVMRCKTLLGRNPRLAGIKHLNRLEQVLASRELGDADEGLVADAEGQVIEGTRSNLFLELDGELVTPDLRQCGVAGVMRSVVLDACEREGIDVRVDSISWQELEQADALFMTGSLMGVVPVRELQGRKLPTCTYLQRLRDSIADGPEGEAWHP